MSGNVMHLRFAKAAYVVLALLAAGLTFHASSLAQSPVEAPAASPGVPKALPGLGAPAHAPMAGGEGASGPATGVWGWILKKQQDVNRSLTAAVRELKQTGSMTSAGMLAFLSFAYGVLHAAGPGHGKAVISSYVLADERTLRRGIMLSALAAFIQALSAITIVGVLYGVLKTTSLQMRVAEAWIETISWAFVAAAGAWLLWQQAGKWKSANLKKHASLPLTRPASTHDHDHGHSRTHAHVHSADCGCGHSHMPEAKQLESELSWRNALAIALSVGIRPCTGAILVLVFALSQGMMWAGVFATFAMAAGTAITVSAFAAMAVGSRELALRVAGDQGNWGQHIELAAGIAGSAAIFLLGSAFFIASLQGPAPL